MTKYDASLVLFTNLLVNFFQEIMASLVEILMFLLSMYIVCTDCYHVRCNFYEETRTLYIVGLKSNEDFDNYGLKCGDYDLEILVYKECWLGKILLPVNRIMVNYPNVKEIYWQCEGYCTQEISRVNIFGCDSGKRTPFI